MDSAAVLEVLDDHGFGHWTDAKKIRFVNYSLHEILDTEYWPFLISEETATTTATNANLPITGLWKDIIAIGDTSNNRLLVPQDRQDLVRHYLGDLTAAGKPLYYYFINGTDGANELDIELHPIPDATYNIKVMYHLGQADLTTGGTEASNLLPPKYHMMLVHKTLSHLYAMDDELETGQYFDGLYNKGMERLRAQMHTTQLDRQQVAVDYFPDAGFLD